MKYLAIIKIDGSEYIVYPRSKKRYTFASVAMAEKALERKGKQFPSPCNIRGIIKDMNSVVVKYIAI